MHIICFNFAHDNCILICSFVEEQALAETRVAGKVKLDLRYIEQSKKFNIMVQHVQGLVSTICL